MIERVGGTTQRMLEIETLEPDRKNCQNLMNSQHNSFGFRCQT